MRPHHGSHVHDVDVVDETFDRCGRQWIVDVRQIGPECRNSNLFRA